MRSFWILRLGKSNTFAKTGILLLFSIFILFLSSRAQSLLPSKTYPTDFIPPLDIRPLLAGSFGEIRTNHFHSGLDYRTNQREGYPVYAVADGYVARLRVQIGGFGNALYIAHPNGYTSVYAHLQRFNERITQILRDYQYRIQSYDVDFPLLPIEIPVKKGEIIAWSGNTGSSGGPHLHFELRDTQTEETINPQLFGIDIPDQVKPQISGLYVYKLHEQPFNPNTPKQFIPVTGGDGVYRIAKPEIEINGETGFGIVTSDQQIPGGSRNGVYSIELLMDGQIIFSSMLERFAFHHSRAINAHIDFPTYITTRRTIQKSFLEPGNPLGIYKNVVNKGLVNLSDDKPHELEYIVKDTKGNTSRLTFKLKRNLALSSSGTLAPGIKTFKHDRINEFSAENLKLVIPKDILYSDINFTYSIKKRPNAYSELHTLHNRLTPLHDTFSLYIKPDKSLEEHLRSKALIVNANGGFAAGKYDEKTGFIKASPKTFGSFFVALDTIAPLVRPINISDNKSMAGENRIVFKISDNLSGIRSFTGTIDGQWMLMEYDLKSSILWHTFDYRTQPGKHLLQLSVTDMQNNTRTYTSSFYK